MHFFNLRSWWLCQNAQLVNGELKCKTGIWGWGSFVLSISLVRNSLITLLARNTETYIGDSKFIIGYYSKGNQSIPSLIYSIIALLNDSVLCIWGNPSILCPIKTASWVLWDKFQILTVLSSPPDIMNLPSWLIQTDLTIFVCPVNTASWVLFAKLHILTVVSKLPDMINLPSPSEHTEFTQPVCPVSWVLTKLPIFICDWFSASSNYFIKTLLLSDSKF
jgi:hypothetical protein